MDHLDAAKLEEFKTSMKFYVPNNAVLVVAGDFNATQTKEWIQNTLVR
jgi:predicted Zn-dependent peptidase